ncbi:MAG: hypothetical protein M3N43_05800 [Actinomycetota bacterium]|nr:hypothetical protein [Actinomycetota bacterium]
MSELRLIPALRPGETFPGGAYKTQRHYWDLVVDGRSLRSYLPAPGDEIPPIGWGTDAWHAEALAEFLLERPSSLPTDRRPILVCPECGDLGCQTLTAVIEQIDGLIMWRAFAYQNNWDAGLTPIDIPAFSFDLEAYRMVFTDAAFLGRDAQENGT